MSDETNTENKSPGKSFGDSWISLALMVAFIVLGRIYLLEPFKIPSGSMEPTLIGHEDFGDRILTNKLAYVSFGQALLAAGAFFVLILQGLSWALDYARHGKVRNLIPFGVCVFLIAMVVVKSFRFDFYQPWLDWVGLGLFALLFLHTLYWYARNFSSLKADNGAVKWALIFLVLILGGMSYAWSQSAIAAEPKRFDVPVFEYNTDWSDSPAKIQDINYIKRLTGLPGERIMISGGDLFLYDPKTEKFNIIRKWKERGEALQDALWFPVSKAFEPRFSDPELQNTAEEALVKQQLRDLTFPWTGAEDDAPGAKLVEKALELNGVAPVDLKFKFPISNIYLKQGRWPFSHVSCPQSKLPPLKSPDGISWRNPNSTGEEIEAVVSNIWEGVQCPNCKHILYPLSIGAFSDKTMLRGRQDSSAGQTRFFYGGQYLVGDLKIDMKLHVETSGSLHLEVGNTLRRAVWNIPGGGEADTNEGLGDGKGGRQHFVQKQTPALAPGDYTLSLAYVDGTVIAVLDGTEIDRRELDVDPLSMKLNSAAETIARVGLTGVKGNITALNVSRDLYYTTVLQGYSDRRNTDMMSRRAQKNAKFDEDDNLVIKVQEGEYLMMGDNSPSSSDGRVWGFVPRERLMGRAWVVGWPLSRWKFIK